MKSQFMPTLVTRLRSYSAHRRSLYLTCGLLAMFLLGYGGLRWKASAGAAPLVGAPAAAMMNCVAPPAGMISWHPLDEFAGVTVVNDIQGPHHGMPKPGTVLGTNSPVPVAGKVAGALRFSGVSSGGDVPHVEVADTPALDLAFSVGFTIDAWIKLPDSLIAGQKLPIVDKIGGTGPYTGYAFYVGGPTGSELVFDIATTNSPFIKTLASGLGHLTPGAWQHVAVSYDRDPGPGIVTGTLYVDGQAVITAGGTQNVVPNDLPLLIGKTRYPGPVGAIEIDELEIFNRPLDQSAISLIWGADSAGKCKPNTKACCGEWKQRDPLPTPTPSPRFLHAMAQATKCKKVVMFGGQTGASINTVNDETWEWDPNTPTWTKVPTGGMHPPARAGHAMTYDSINNKVVLFGGYNASNTKLSDTWEYDCTNRIWLNRTQPGVTPPARAFHAMAYDPDIGTVLYGGFGASHFADTWRWNGTTWLDLSSAAPGTRVSHAMAFDGSKIVLFGGGLIIVGAGQGDTWTFDPISKIWSQVATTVAPSPRLGHAMAYSSACRRVILYGGEPKDFLNPNAPFPADTWEWDGMKWCELGTNPPPGPRSHTAMAFDGNFPLLFGGRAPTSTLLGDTWNFGCNSPITSTGGWMDKFSLAGAMDPHFRRAELNAAFSAVIWKKFDVTTHNQWVGHSFNLGSQASDIVRAEIEVRMKPGSLNNPLNDSVNFAFAKTGDPTPIKWGIQMGTLTGSTWFNVPAQTFTFDLANLPVSGAFSTNLLPQLIANQFLDVVIQNDTVVDYIKLRYWRCPVEFKWSGKGGLPDGQAELVVNSSGNLAISNIGASGNDGVTFRLGETSGASIKLANTFSALPNGSHVEMRGIGRVNGTPDSPTGSMRLTRVNDRVSMTPNYSALGASTFHLALYNDGNNVFSQGGLSGNTVSAPAAAVAPLLQFGGSGNIIIVEDIGAIQIIIVEDMSGIRVSGLDIGTGDTLVFTPENPTQPVEALTNLRVTGAGLSSGLVLTGLTTSFLSSETGPLHVFPPSCRVSGNAHLEPFDGGIGVANIGESGQDGVIFDLSKSQRFNLNFDEIDMNRDLPPGAYLEASVAHIQNLLPTPPARISSLKLIKGPDSATAAGKTEYVADFSSLGATALRVTGFSGETQVTEVANFTGTLETIGFPSTLAHTGTIEWGFQMDFPDGTVLTMTGQPGVSITTLRISPMSTNVQIAYLSELALRASGIPRVSVTEPAIVPLCNSPITIAPANLPPAVMGLPYPLTQLSASGGLPPHRFSATGLPAGLTLSPTGVLSGTPTQSGSFNVTVTVNDSLKCAGTKVYNLAGCGIITVNPNSPALPDGTVGAAYNQTFTQTGGMGTVTWSISAGAAPAGLTLNPTTGAFTGTPTAAGSFSFTVKVTDANLCMGERVYLLTIGCPTITVNPATIPNGTVGSAYSQTFTATGGTAPYTFTLATGVFPPSTTLSPTGTLSGTPSAAGTFNFTIRATAANGCFGERQYTLAINQACPTVTGINPASGAVGATVTITGTNLTGVTGVKFTNNVTATFNIVNSTTITATVPAGAATGAITISKTGCADVQTAGFTVIGGSGLQFYPLPATVRALETRPGFSGCTIPGAPILANTTFTLAMRTGCTGIPANATAVTGNITVVPQFSAGGYLTLFPSNAAQPIVANSNFTPGEITNNVFTVGLGPADGAFKIFASATTHVIVDVTGYFAPPSPAGLYFHPLDEPVRLVETRTLPGLLGCIKPGVPFPVGATEVQGRSPVASPCNVIPATAQVLVGNATTVFPPAGGFLTLYSSDAIQPLAASSNYAGGDVINGPFAVKLGADGKFKVFTPVATDLVIDILGYYSTDAVDANGTGLLFTILPKPVRELETRPDFPGFPLTGCYRTNGPIQGGPAGIRTQPVWGVCDGLTIPNTARAILGNVTVVNPIGAGYLTFYPGNVATAPTVATSNYPFPVIFGYNRHFFVGLSPTDGTFRILTSATTDLIVDVSGYFAP